jgi:hypothetical protein
MRKLSTAQKIYTAVIITIAVAWLGLQLGVPAYEYSHGKSAFTALLEHATAILQYALFGAIILAWLLQRIGVLPTVQPDPALDRMVNPKARLKYLAIWVVIALLLVFLFNLFQGTKNSGNDSAIAFVINYLPIALLAGGWIFLMMRMSAKKKKKDLEGGSNT